MAVDLSASITTPTGFTLDNGTAAGVGTPTQAAQLLRASTLGSSLSVYDLSTSYRGFCPTATSITNATQTADTVVFFPVSFPKASIVELGIVVVTAGAASTKARVGVYSPRSNSLTPGVKLIDSGELATDSTGYKSAAVSLSVVPGALYFGAYNFSGAPVVASSSGPGSLPMAFHTTLQSIRLAMSRSVTFGALPSDESANTSYSYSTSGPVFIFWR